ncbi:hypothetical protein JCM8547_000749 [Rhodosporidiobolus lusitaniae]
MPAKRDPGAVTLPLVPGRKSEPLSFFGGLHLVVTLSAHLFIFLPLRVLASYTLLRFTSGPSSFGRPLKADALAKFIQFFFSRASVPQARTLFNSATAYAVAYALPGWTGKREWVEKVDVNGTKGRWIAKPGTKRSEDDVVLYYVHGGGFTTDTGSGAQRLLLDTIIKLKEKIGLTASAFSLDYKLAPEYKFPSQLLEVLAGYHHLVNTLGISPSKIVLMGDSAGGNLVTSFLLHLARPSPHIKVPSSLGPTPGKPGGALLLSPEVNVCSLSTSSRTNIPFDVTSPGFCFRGAFDYMGARLPWTHRFRTRWVLNPLWHLVDPQRLPPVPAEQLPEYEGLVDLGWSEIEGIELLKSPYVNPGAVVKDSEWLKEAFPGDGKTVVAWGGLEVLADDVESFFRQLEKAGVKPKKLFKPYGVHNWVILESLFPSLGRSKSSGPDRSPSYGPDNLLSLLISVSDAFRFSSADEPEAKTTAREEKPICAKPYQPLSSGTSFADAAASTEHIPEQKADSAIVVEGEGKTLEAKLEDGKLVAEKKKTAAEPVGQPVKNFTPVPHAPVLPGTKPPANGSPAVSKPTTAPDVEAEKKKSKKKSQKKAVPPPGNERSSFAAAAASKNLDPAAPVVAKGEGDVLVPQLVDGHVTSAFETGKAEAAGKPGAATGGAGSWAKVAGHEADEDAPVVAEGEGGKLESKLEGGTVVTESA